MFCLSFIRLAVSFLSDFALSLATSVIRSSDFSGFELLDVAFSMFLHLQENFVSLCFIFLIKNANKYFSSLNARVSAENRGTLFSAFASSVLSSIKLYLNFHYDLPIVALKTTIDNHTKF